MCPVPPDPSTPSSAVPSVDARRTLEARDAVVVDLRSPAEFEADHLPGARSIPLFDNPERALIGTLFVQRSPGEAFDEGLGLLEGKIADLVGAIGRVAGWEPPPVDLVGRLRERTRGGLSASEERFAARPVRELPGRPVILYCWRGGLRSRSVTAFVRELGLERALVLEGGYKAWRRLVIDGLEAFEAPPSISLRGLTGVGKTLVLRELERIRPGWTVDLEGLAGHRSSILGMVGLEPVSQKAFETRLFARLHAGFPGPAVFEGESRKVGDAIIPARVWAALAGSTALLLSAGLERRVQVLIEDYLTSERSAAQLRGQLPFIEERLGAKRWAGELVALLDGGRTRELTELLLEHYYDPLYRHSERDWNYAAEFDTSDPQRAAAEIAGWVESHPLAAGGTDRAESRLT